MAFQGFSCVAFAEMLRSRILASFAGPLRLLASFPNELSIDKPIKTAIASFNTRVCMSSDSSHSTSLLRANYQVSWLSSAPTADMAHMVHGTAAYCAIACNVHSCGYSVDSLSSCMHGTSATCNNTCEVGHAMD